MSRSWSRFHRESRRRSDAAPDSASPIRRPSVLSAFDGDGRVERFVEKPAPGTAPSNLVNAGTYVLEPSVLQRIPAGEKVSIERVTFPAVAADRGMFGMATDDYWIDTGRPELYLQANLDVLSGKRRNDRCVSVHDEATVATSAIVDDSIVGAGATIGADTVVRGSVILPRRRRRRARRRSQTRW